MENEIIMNEEVIEAAEGVGNSKKGLLTLGVAAAAITAGVLLVKKVIVPAVKRHKAKKEAEAELVEEDRFNEDM
jgi:hypothetical protein